MTTTNRILETLDHWAKVARRNGDQQAAERYARNALAAGCGSGQSRARRDTAWMS